MRTRVAGCAFTAVLALLSAASGAQGYRVVAGEVAMLPGRYLVTTFNPKVNVTKPGAKAESVELLDGHGRLLRRIEQGCCGIYNARFSPNGRMIAWIDKGGLYVENTSGADRRLLVAASAHCTLQCVGMSYAWAPDSGTIAVGGAGTQTGELVTVDVPTGTATRIAPAVRFTGYDVIGYSADGSQLAIDIQSGDAGTSSCCKSLLVVEHPDGTGARVLFSFFDAIHDGPQDATWSPDGHKLAFTEDGMDIRDPRFGIVDVATSSVRPITGLNVADSSPVWSPDGSRLTAVSYTTHPSLTYSVNTVDLASGKSTKIGLGSVPIAWYPDGTILTVGGKDGNILYALNVAGGVQRAIFTLPKPLELLTVEPAP
jgi:Tol biopolymer transport system component